MKVLKEKMVNKPTAKKKTLAFDDNFEMPVRAVKESFEAPIEKDDSFLAPDKKRAKKCQKTVSEAFCEAFEVNGKSEDGKYNAYMVNEGDIPDDMCYSSYCCDAVDDNTVHIDWVTEKDFSDSDAEQLEMEIRRLANLLLSGVLSKDFIDDNLDVEVVVESADKATKHECKFSL